MSAIAVLAPTPAGAATAIDLGTATSFAVLAGSGITNTGATTITGDVGSHETTTMTGFESVTLDGVNHGGDAVTQGAKDDLTTAYNQAFASAPATSVATELGGTTLTPGVYHGTTLGITGALTLDTQGDPDAVFVFQTDSTLITAAASSVVVLGGATACNVYWQVGSSATFGVNSTLLGTVLADTSITANNGATFQGRLLARGGAVTLHRNTIHARSCAGGVAPTTTGDTTTGDTTTGDAATGTVVPGDGTTADGAPAVPVAVTTPAPAPAPPPPARTTSRPGGGTTTGAERPPLASTGPVTDGVPLLGALTVALGLLLVRAARPLPALRHAVPRPGRTEPKEASWRR